MRTEETCRTWEGNGHSFPCMGQVCPCQALCPTNALPQGFGSSVQVSAAK